MDFPRSLPEFLRHYDDEAVCQAALAQWRWHNGFICPGCGQSRVRVSTKDLWTCRACNRQTSLTAGTILADSHLPLTTWFAAAYLLSGHRGVSSLVLERQLGLGNKRTPLLMLRRFREAMEISLTKPLSGQVEIDETLVGGVSPGIKGRTTAGTTKRMVLVAAERGAGRVRMRVIPNAQARTLEPLIVKLVAPGSTIITDGYAGYQHLPRLGYTWIRRPHPPGGMKADSLHATPLVDGLIAQFKDWLRDTYRKPPTNLDPYLAEFCFYREFRDPQIAIPLLLTGRRP